MILVHNPNAAFPVNANQCCSRIAEEWHQFAPVPQSSQALGGIIWLSSRQEAQLETGRTAHVLKCFTGSEPREESDTVHWEMTHLEMIKVIRALAVGLCYCSFRNKLWMLQVMAHKGCVFFKCCPFCGSSACCIWNVRQYTNVQIWNFSVTLQWQGKAAAVSLCDISAITELPIYRSWVFGTALLTLEAATSAVQYLGMWPCCCSESRNKHEIPH